MGSEAVLNAASLLKTYLSGLYGEDLRQTGYSKAIHLAAFFELRNTG
jgi:hypothetical protein